MKLVKTTNKTNVAKLKPEITPSQMFEDIRKVIVPLLEGKDIVLKDMALIYREEGNGSYGYVGQNLKDVDPVDTIGLLELLKIGFCKATYSTDLDEE